MLEEHIQMFPTRLETCATCKSFRVIPNDLMESHGGIPTDPCNL